MASQRRAIRIAGCSGSASDRREALALLAHNVPSDPLDVVVGDWLSEANMTSRGLSKVDNPDAAAYEPTLIESLKPALVDLAKHKVKLVVNAGASDTKKLHDVVTDLIQDNGLSLKVAWIEGDEVMPLVQEAIDSNNSFDFTNIYTCEKLSQWKPRPLYAQAYLGGMGIAAALEAGADIVICGRVSDASLVVGAAVWWHKWTSEQFHHLANALIAGHLIECCSYITGGNFSGFKALEFTDWTQFGYPIAEISSSGSVTITKNESSKGGEVSMNTCTSQLLYEIQGPLYFNSDVTANLTDISFSYESANRISLHEVTGSPPPPTTKVGITARGGFQAEAIWYMTGLDIPEKARMLEVQIRHQLRPHSARFDSLTFSILGSVPEDPKSQNAATVTVRILAQAPVESDLAPRRFARPIVDAIMCSYPGATPNLDLRTAFPRPIFEYFVTTVQQDKLRHVAHTPWAGAAQSSIPISAPGNTKVYTRQPITPPAPTPSTSITEARSAKGGTTDAAGGWAELAALSGKQTIREVFGPWGRTVRGPLGWLVHARSGDKGCDANVGFWVVHGGGEYEWLRALLTIERVKHLLGAEWEGQEAEKKGKSIERCEFEGLRAVHLLLKGHLDRGVGVTRSVDALGKNVAEFLRARHVDLPVKFLQRGKI